MKKKQAHKYYEQKENRKKQLYIIDLIRSAKNKIHQMKYILGYDN